MSDKINKFPAHLFRQTGASCHAVPSQAAVHRFVDDLTNLLFPLRDDLPITEVQIAARWERLQHDFLPLFGHCAPAPKPIVNHSSSNFSTKYRPFMMR